MEKNITMTNTAEITNTTDMTKIPNIPSLLEKISGSEDEALYQLTEEYLKTVDRDNPPSAREIKNGMIDMIATVFEAWNELSGKHRRFTPPHTLKPFQICKIMLHLHSIKMINYTDDDSEKLSNLCIYRESGVDAGIYVDDKSVFDQIIRDYNRFITPNGIKEVKEALSTYAERVRRCSDPDLIAVNNGIFDYRKKELLPFDPKYVFIAKSAVDYNPNAKNAPITNPDGTSWDIESWIEDLFEDEPELVQTIWEVIGACIRPGVDWAKSAWFISSKGNNGKGTLCQLIRGIIGSKASASIKLTDFGKNFALTDLLRSLVIIADENDVGSPIKKCADLKAIITHDPILITRKFESNVKYRFQGFMIQCVNDIPSFKDKTESFYRRMLLIPFNKCFTGEERKYIKNDYIGRKEVQEYVLHKVLHMDYHEISEPKCCKKLLKELKGYNDPVRDFCEEVFTKARINFLPTTLLLDLYPHWSRRNAPGKEKPGRNRFFRELKNIIATEYPDWEYDHTPKDVKSLMKGDEPLLREYNVKEWMDESYMPGKASCKNVIKESKFETKHRGFRRKA